MQLTPEVKAQLAEQKKQCIFCKIAAKEVQSKIVFEDSKTLALLDIYPALKGHTIFLPKEHYPIVPYIPPSEFSYFFSILPQLSRAVKKGMVATGLNIFIANGGAAGQQAPHFMVHLLPRDRGDGFFKFFFDKRKAQQKDKVTSLQQMMNYLLQQHFKQNPASWHTGVGEKPSHLNSLSGDVLYEDEKCLVLFPTKGICEGHLEVHSKTEEKYLERLSAEDSFHLFFVASFAASALFEKYKAHGTNIIVKSGESDDNSSGRLSIHVLCRITNDGLDLMWKPERPSYNIEAVGEKIREQAWSVKYSAPKPVVKKVEVVTNPSQENEIERAIRQLRERG